jgi:hypothetical protein
MTDNYEKKHFSVTGRTQDFAVLHCLRGLSEWAEELHPRNVTWGGTGEAEWRNSKGQFTFHFSDPSFREKFIMRGQELFPCLWEVVRTRDDHPATRQRSPH